MGKVLHILPPSRDIDTYPSVYNAAYVWKKAGWANDLACASPETTMPDLFDGAFLHHLHFLPRLWELRRLCRGYDVVVTYDPRDQRYLYLAMGSSFRRTFGCLVHHSLELPIRVMWGSAQLQPIQRVLYRRAMAKMDKLIIQDELRLGLIRELFPGLTDKPHFLVPNSFIRSLEPASEGLGWYDELRTKYDKLVLYVGGIERWALSFELFDQLKELDDVCFVFSGWSADNLADELIEYCESDEHIVFHLGAKSRSDLNYMVARSDIGLAFYDPKDENVQLLGMSSGKVHKFLSYGVPVICNEQPMLGDFLRDRQFGLACKLGDFGQTVANVLRDHAQFRDAIEKTYADVCDYEAAYQVVVDSFG